VSVFIQNWVNMDIDCNKCNRTSLWWCETADLWLA